VQVRRPRQVKKQHDPPSGGRSALTVRTLALLAAFVFALLLSSPTGSAAGAHPVRLLPAPASAQEPRGPADQQATWYQSDTLRGSTARAGQRAGRERQAPVLLAVLVAALATVALSPQPAPTPSSACSVAARTRRVRSRAPPLSLI